MGFIFHKLSDEKKLRFYQTPKVLFTNDAYKGLGMAEKLFYSVLRDRQELSRKNKWADENGNIYLLFTVENLAELCNISTRTVIRYKKTLAEYDLLKEVIQGRGLPNKIYIGQPKYSEKELLKVKECQEYNPRSDRSTKLEVTEVLPSDTNKSETEKNDIKNIDSQAAARQEVPYKNIVQYLNQQSGKQFNFKAHGNRRYIKARFNEGYKEEDFKKVIDTKVKEWKNTDMEEYLRPATLFGNKFDNYLNQGAIVNGVNRNSNKGSGRSTESETKGYEGTDAIAKYFREKNIQV